MEDQITIEKGRNAKDKPAKPVDHLLWLEQDAGHRRTLGKKKN